MAETGVDMGMKSLAILILSAAFALSSYAQGGQQQTTANYWLANAPQNVGESVTVNVSGAAPSSLIADDGYVCFECDTVGNDGNAGGKIKVMVPVGQTGALMEKYAAAKGKGAPLTANLRVYTWASKAQEYVLVLGD